MPPQMLRQLTAHVARVNPFRVVKISLLFVMSLALAACMDENTSYAVKPGPENLSAPARTAAVTAPQKPERYLDQMAIIDAHKDFSQSPNPDYVLDARSVLRFPKTYPIGVIIIGDSILTGWSGYFAHVFPNALISGRVGRQFSSAIPIWKTMQQTRITQGVGDVVIELGTNGEVLPSDLQELLRMIGHRQVFLVMPEMPRSWEHEVQQLYLQTAATHPNVHLVRWDLLSRDHPQYFWTDLVHPNWQGIQVMVHAIAHDIQKTETTH
ncbi:acyltransferase [Acidithiobacillus marinus]|uniref:Acyltransferase n=1 Tax=Acidithiobacillus marinus TaxID=187490 RepID=A0A2I1DMV1_9PROT|nr:acyltransferase [Acidithiobacillus marinus]PKY11192.1 acyltransferase [Acidithiobacillus marinus]